jgi:hypothetical protein
MKYIIVSFLLIAFYSCSESTGSQPFPPGQLERLENFSSEYVTDRHVDIWLPEGYEESKTYAVLYMHDGQNLFRPGRNRQSWKVGETLHRLIQEGEIRETIVVGIWNAGRERGMDYFPQKPFENLAESTQDSLINVYSEEQQFLIKGPQSDNYLKFIIEELKPHVDQNYSTQTDRENTFIAGSSLGGLISIYALCEYPEIFGGAAGLSTHWPGVYPQEGNTVVPDAFVDYLSDNLPYPGDHKIYFDYGTEAFDQHYEPHQQKVDSVMEARGFTSADWKTLKFEGAGHSEKVWAERLHIPMKFLLGK